MKLRVFFFFVFPSLLLMLLFIFIPLVSVFSQSFYITQPKVAIQEVETCTPGILEQTCITENKQLPVLDEQGKIINETLFVGMENYFNVLEIDVLKQAIANEEWGNILKIDFWSALRFTLMFTFITLPLVLLLGLLVALTVNSLIEKLRGVIIFVSLLPFIITPVIGALSIKWLFVGDGILTALLEWYFQKDIAMFSSGWTIEILMLFYRVWHVAPFAFVVFYAGLQTLNRDSLESSIIDGANHWQRLLYVIVPHLMPLIIFVSLIHLMDAYRVFDEVVAFSSQAYVISLQWLTYDFLVPNDSGYRSISRASASAMLTMIGIAIILIPLLMRTWNDYRGEKN